jgi:segregation and condensation protein B
LNKEINSFDLKSTEELIEKKIIEKSSEQIVEPTNEIKEDQSLEVKQAVEALLFATSSPISLKKIYNIIKDIFDTSLPKIRQSLNSLQQDYLTSKKSFQIDEIAEGYVLRTRPQFYPLVSRLLSTQHKSDKLSSATCEVLAIIAYKQPCTRALIDSLRGVDSSGALANLLDRQLVESQGKLEAPGRPTIYGTSKKFMEHYGLRNLKELPIPQPSNESDS